MEKDVVIGRLGARRNELRAMGLASLSVFGSTARGEAGPESDVDLAVKFDPEQRIGLFRYAEIAAEIEAILGAKIDLVCEPARRARIQSAINRDRVLVF